MGSKKVPGQNHIKDHFKSAIVQGKVSHAYIISGDKGTGKMQLAREFAKALQCQENGADQTQCTGQACNQCKSCRQSESFSQPDIKYITYEKTGIGVNEIREQINDDVDIIPYGSRYKIYIVPQSETMTIAAQNALLKTIEEPPAYVVILLLTTNMEVFLPTILSRCVLLHIRPVKDTVIKNYLMNEYGIGSREAEIATVFATGNPGKAVEIVSSEDFRELKKIVVDTVISLGDRGMDMIAESVKRISEFKNNMDRYFELLRLWFRDVLMYKSTGNVEKLIFQEEQSYIFDMAETISFYHIHMIFQAIEEAQKRISANVNFDMAMEAMFLAIRQKLNCREY